MRLLGARSGGAPMGPDHVRLLAGSALASASCPACPPAGVFLSNSESGVPSLVPRSTQHPPARGSQRCEQSRPRRRGCGPCGLVSHDHLQGHLPPTAPRTELLGQLDYLFVQTPAQGLATTRHGAVCGSHVDRGLSAAPPHHPAILHARRGHAALQLAPSQAWLGLGQAGSPRPIVKAGHPGDARLA